MDIFPKRVIFHLLFLSSKNKMYRSVLHKRWSKSRLEHFQKNKTRLVKWLRQNKQKPIPDMAEVRLVNKASALESVSLPKVDRVQFSLTDTEELWHPPGHSYVIRETDNWGR